MASEHSMILNICPSNGLLFQDYKCAECQSYIRIRNLKVSPGNLLNLYFYNFIYKLFLFLEDSLSLEARLCDYDGKFYCPLHHWNYTAVIPARVICNWQFEKKRVSQASLQLLNYKFTSKIYDLEKYNPKLFTYLDSLGQIKVRNSFLVFKS